MESSSPGLLKNGKMNLCMSMGSRENKQNKVRTQLWDTLYVILFCVTIIVLLHYRTWADSLPFEIPFGFATTFKSDEDWLDDWEELEEAPRK